MIRVYGSTVLVFLFALAAWPALATNSCQSVFEPFAKPRVALVIEKLQTPGTGALIDQDPFLSLIDPNGGGACATVSAVNLVQILRAQSGEREILEPREMVLASYKDLPVLLDGRVTNTQLIELLNYLKKYSPGQDYTVSFDGNAAKMTEASLDLKENELKLVTYRVYDERGKKIGRHFVLLKARTGADRVSFVDPNRPYSNYDYRMLRSDYARKHQSSLQFSRADGKGRFNNVLDAIITVRLL